MATLDGMQAMRVVLASAGVVREENRLAQGAANKHAQIGQDGMHLMAVNDVGPEQVGAERPPRAG